MRDSMRLLKGKSNMYSSGAETAKGFLSTLYALLGSLHLSLGTSLDLSLNERSIILGNGLTLASEVLLVETSELGLNLVVGHLGHGVGDRDVGAVLGESGGEDEINLLEGATGGLNVLLREWEVSGCDGGGTSDGPKEDSRRSR